MILIAIISDPKKLSGRLTSAFAGSPAFHIGFGDDEGDKWYDMNLLFRRRRWPHYPAESVTLYQCPVIITAENLEEELDTSEDWYSPLDYLAFGLKKIFRKWRPSFKGAICSEKVEQVLVKYGGWVSPFDSTPSPTDFERVLTLVTG